MALGPSQKDHNLNASEMLMTDATSCRATVAADEVSGRHVLPGFIFHPDQLALLEDCRMK